MAITERALSDVGYRTESVTENFPLNTGVISAYYEARSLLGIPTEEQRLSLNPHIATFKVHNSFGAPFVVREGPDVSQMINDLMDKRDLADTPIDKRRRMSIAIDILDKNSTKSYWELGNRKTDTVFKTHRVFHEGNEIARELNNNVLTDEIMSYAEELLDHRRELILSEDPEFYRVESQESDSESESRSRRRFSNAVELWRAKLAPRVDSHLEVTADDGEDAEGIQVDNVKVTAVLTGDRSEDDKNIGEADYHEVLTATEVRKKRNRERKRYVRVKPSKGLVAAGVLLTTVVPAAGLQAAGRIDVLNRSKAGSISRVVDQSTPTTVEIRPGVTIALPTVEPSTTTTTVRVATALPVTTTTEAPKPKDPIGIAWLSETMKPWKEKIAAEAKNYPGFDPALPAIYAQIKTAGDYTAGYRDDTQGYLGLFLLSETLIAEGAKALGIENPLAVDANVNIRIGVWYIAKKFKESSGSIRATAIGLEGSSGEVADFVEGMWNERKDEASPTFNKWKAKYGYREDKAREKLKGVL